MTEFRKYRRKQIVEFRPYIVGEELQGVTISYVDKEAKSPKEGDMIARNPVDHNEQWHVTKDYFRANFVPME